MMHPQHRRHPQPEDAPQDAQQIEADDVDGSPAIPRQTRPRPDAYDLYAQIYALRTSAADEEPPPD